MISPTTENGVNQSRLPPQRETHTEDTLAVAVEGFTTARRQAENLVSKFPAVALVTALAAGVAIGCLIKRS